MRTLTYSALDMLVSGTWQIISNLKLMVLCFMVSQVIALASVMKVFL